MNDPRVQERDNPLVRRLNAVAEENSRLGTALGGGARPPRPPVGPVMGGTSTVLPPPAVPLTAEEALGDSLPPAEAEELERRWATDPSNPANRMAPNRAITPAPVGDAAAENAAAPRAPFLQFVPTPEPKASQIDYVNLIKVLPITEDQRQQVRGWVFDGMVKIVAAETNRQLDNMRVALGLVPPPAKETKSAVQGPGSQEGVEPPVATSPPGQVATPSPKPARKRRAATRRRSPGKSDL